MRDAPDHTSDVIAQVMITAAQETALGQGEMSINMIQAIHKERLNLAQTYAISLEQKSNARETYNTCVTTSDMCERMLDITKRTPENNQTGFF